MPFYYVGIPHILLIFLNIFYFIDAESHYSVYSDLNSQSSSLNFLSSVITNISYHTLILRSLLSR